MEIHSDDRGMLYEIPSCIGTQFISTSNSGVIRGNHYHKIKTEGFTVLSGMAVMRTRTLGVDMCSTQILFGSHPQIVIIHPNVVHSIENIGHSGLVLLVQSDQIFDPANADTYSEDV